MSGFFYLAKFVFNDPCAWEFLSLAVEIIYKCFRASIYPSLLKIPHWI